MLATIVFTLLSTGLAIPGPSRPQVSMRALRLVQAGQVATEGWKTTVVPEISTELVAVQWSGARAGAVDIRVQQDGTWLPWKTLEGNPDEGPDMDSPEYRGTTTAGPAWTGQDVDRIEVRVAEGPLPGLKLHMIHSPDSQKSWSAPSASAFPGRPGFISRGQWGANESIRNTAPDWEKSPEFASTVRNAIVHHTVNLNTYSAEEAPALVRGIYEFHVQANRWCDIGYNFIVDRFGRVFEGRYGGVEKAVIGAHAGGFNSGSTGAAVLGDFRSAAPSAGAMIGLRDLLAWKLALHGVDPRSQVWVTSGGNSKYPAGQVVTLPNISAHRDVSDTECPGGQLYTRVPQLRLDVQTAMLATAPYPLPGWTPAGNQPKVVAVNSYGGLQPAGGQPALPHPGYWGGWNIIRGVAPSTGASGYVLDGWGGLHPFGGAPPATGHGYWPGWDIARGAVVSAPGSGYTLDGWGGLHPFGAAVPLGVSGYWKGWDIAKGLVLRSDASGGYVLDGFGGIHTFGLAPPIQKSTTSYWGWNIARDIALRPDGTTGYVLDGWGGVHPFGGAPPVNISRYTPGSDEIKALVLNDAGTGGWTVDLNGYLWPFGSAGFVKQSSTWSHLGIGRDVVLLH